VCLCLCYKMQRLNQYTHARTYTHMRTKTLRVISPYPNTERAASPAQPVALTDELERIRMEAVVTLQAPSVNVPARVEGNPCHLK
jgi:hypothetical protein